MQKTRKDRSQYWKHKEPINMQKMLHLFRNQGKGELKLQRDTTVHPPGCKNRHHQVLRGVPAVGGATCLGTGVALHPASDPTLRRQPREGTAQVHSSPSS